jgi:hypothetical protein
MFKKKQAIAIDVQKETRAIAMDVKKHPQETPEWLGYSTTTINSHLPMIMAGHDGGEWCSASSF